MIRLGELAAMLNAELLEAEACSGSGRRRTQDIADGADGADIGDIGDIGIVDVDHDSRDAKPQTLFACLRGDRFDGHNFADQAVAAGAAALLVERAVPAGVPMLKVDSVRACLGSAASAVHAYPARRLQMAGVTGTNGKTTTVRLLAGVLRKAGWDVTEIGTLTGRLTTPEATDLQRQLGYAVRRGHQSVVMEVSSHALEQQRIQGCRFKVAAFTNLGHDHLDFHRSLQDYFRAKASLFSNELTECAVIDVRTSWGRQLAELVGDRLPVTQIDDSACQLLDADARSSLFVWRGQRVRLPLPGAFNRSNAVVAAEMALQLGVSAAEVAAALHEALPVPGRFEAIDAGQDFCVIVDYAHTPDALAAALRVAHDTARGQLIVVFGAGGDRDHEKRPEMGAAAAALADRTIITSDNPRSEDPEAIIQQIESGMDRPADILEADRRLAIRHSLKLARRGDTVLVAGKGHERTQTIGTQVFEFDDRAVVTEELRRQLNHCGAAS